MRITTEQIRKIYYYFYVENRGLMEIGRLIGLSRYAVSYWLGKYKRKPCFKDKSIKDLIKNDKKRLKADYRFYKNFIFNNASKENPKKLGQSLRAKFKKTTGLWPEQVGS